MPQQPPRRCSACSRLFTGERCPSCVQARDERRPSAARRGYCSARWRRLRAAKLSHDPLCSVCHDPATEVDHLERHDGPDDPRFWQFDNLDSKCKACHSRKTALVDSAFVQRDDRGPNATRTAPTANRRGMKLKRGQNPRGEWPVLA